MERWNAMNAAIGFCGLVAGVSGCSETAPEGGARACYAERDDDLEEGFAAEQRNSGGVDRTGLRLVAVDDETEPPARFDDCAAGMRSRAEFIDDGDRHLWVAAEAHQGARDLIPEGIFSIVDRATLRFQQQGGFAPSTSLSVVNGKKIVVALQSTATLDGDIGDLVVEDAGTNALPSWGACGSTTTKALRFSDDRGDRTMANGETFELTVDGTELLGTNIFSAEYGASNCEDGPSGETHVTWVASENSF